MSSQALNVTKKRGRPPKDPTVVVRLPAATVSTIDKWAEKQGVTRAEAASAMIDAAIKAGGLSD